MSDFKETCIWMSYRYAIGRSSIASNMHALDIARNMDWVPKNRWEFTGKDILREINGRIKWYKNIHDNAYGDPTTDIFSIIFDWFIDNPQEDNVEYFVSHDWYVNTVRGVIDNIEERKPEDIPEKLNGLYYTGNLFADYSDFKNWIRLAKLFLNDVKYITYKSKIRKGINSPLEEVIETHTCISWHDLSNDYKVSKKYSLYNEVMSGWYIAPEYILSVQDKI